MPKCKRTWRKLDLSAVEQRVFTLLRDAGEEGVSIRELAKDLYGKRKDGGPENIHRTLHVVITRINKKLYLKEAGRVIVTRPGNGVKARRYLETVAEQSERRLD